MNYVLINPHRCYHLILTGVTIQSSHMLQFSPHRSFIQFNPQRYYHIILTGATIQTSQMLTLFSHRYLYSLLTDVNNH